MADNILEPLDYYKNELKEKHLNNTKKYFDELASKAKVDIEENRKTIAKYNSGVTLLNNLSSRNSKLKTLKGFIIFFIVSFIIFTIVCFYQIAINKNVTLFIILAIISILAVVALFILLNKKIKKEIESLDNKIKEVKNKNEILKNEAFIQMAPLNALFDYGMPQKIINESLEKVKLDIILDEKKYEYLNENYGFRYNAKEDTSITLVQSGEIIGNPFVLIKEKKQKMQMKTYTGCKTIHWTTTVHTKEGNRTVSHSQVLTASIQMPAPFYYNKTYLVYGNEAASDLSFSREISEGSKLEGKEYQRFINKKSKEFTKKAKLALTDNDDSTNYNKLGNDEFEAIFDGTNRDNEIQYRLLYTPLAQKNVINLLRSKDGYGDDFRQLKIKKVNVIQSKHSSTMDYDVSPTKFMGNDFDKMKDYFIEFNKNYFKGIYFDLAPLLAIPLYQQTKPKPYYYKDYYPKNISNHEYEATANSFNEAEFKPNDCVTPLILKTTFKEKVGSSDLISVKALGFKGIKKMTTKIVLGGDGHHHSIPISYIEYVPVSKVTNMLIEAKESSREQYNNIKNDSNFKQVINELTSGNKMLYKKGILALLTYGAIKEESVIKLNDAFDKAINSNTTNKIEDVVSKLIEEEKLEEQLKHLKENNEIEEILDDYSSNSDKNDESSN